MSTITTPDGTSIFYKDWGPRAGQPIVFHHGWPLSADDWDNQMLFFLAKGFRDLKCDHKQFVRAICLTEAYGRSSRTTVNRDDRDEYAKLVHLEQLYGQGVVRPIDAHATQFVVLSGGFASGGAVQSGVTVAILAGGVASGVTVSRGGRLIV